MKNFLLLLCCMSFSTAAMAQRIAPIFDAGDTYPFSYFNQDVETFCAFNNQIFLAGRNISAFGETSINKVVAWDGIHYTAVGNNDLSLPISHRPRHLYVWNDTLHLLTSAYPDQSLVFAYHPSTGAWQVRGDTLDVRGHQLFTLNNELWLASYQGDLWRWNGMEWIANIASPVAALRDIAVRNDQVYLAGVASAIDRLYTYTNNAWQAIAMPSDAEANSFAVINDSLMVCGAFDFGDGANGLALVSNSAVLPSQRFAYAPTQEALQCEDHVYTLVNSASMYDFDICEGERVIQRAYRVNGPMPEYSLRFQNTLFLPPHNTYVSLTNPVLFTSNSAVLHRVLPAVTTPLHAGSISFNTSGSPMIGLQHLDYTPMMLVENEERVHRFAFMAGIWLSAQINGDTAVAFRTSSNTQQMDSWFFGPVGNVLDDAFMNKYARAWRLSAAEINTHIAHFNESDYHMPEAIANWPAHGNFQNGEAFHLAPFFDANGNSYYEPHLGDYPTIPGDDAIFMMMNDALDQADVEGTVPLRAEVHLFYYTKNDASGNPAIHVHGTVVNRSENTWNNTLLGVYNEWSIGFSSNDYHGVDSLNNYVFAYDRIIEDDFEFDHTSPAAACAVLSDALYQNVFFGYNSDPALGIPFTTAQRIYCMNGLNRLSQPFEGTSTQSPAWQFSGDVCTNEQDTEWATGNSDTAERNFSLSTLQLESLPSGSFYCFDYAYLTTFDTAAVSPENACALDAAVAQLRAAYANDTHVCELSTTIEEAVVASEAQMRVWPNPASDVLHVQWPRAHTGGTISLIDAWGKTVVQSNSNSDIFTVPVNTLADGIYLVRWNHHDAATTVMKWVKQSQ